MIYWIRREEKREEGVCVACVDSTKIIAEVLFYFITELYFYIFCNVSILNFSNLWTKPLFCWET